MIIKYCTFSSICWFFFFSRRFKEWKLLVLKKEKKSERKRSIKLIKNTTAAAPGNLTVQHWRKQRLLAALGSALSKLLSRHKLLVSDQVLCLQLKCTLLWSCWLFRGLFPAWSELEAAVSGGKVGSVTLHTQQLSAPSPAPPSDGFLKWVPTASHCWIWGDAAQERGREGKYKGSTFTDLWQLPPSRRGIVWAEEKNKALRNAASSGSSQPLHPLPTPSQWRRAQRWIWWVHQLLSRVFKI